MHQYQPMLYSFDSILRINWLSIRDEYPLISEKALRVLIQFSTRNVSPPVVCSMHRYLLHQMPTYLS